MAQQLKSRSDPIKKYGSDAAWLLSEAEELKVKKVSPIRDENSR